MQNIRSWSAKKKAAAILGLGLLVILVLMGIGFLVGHETRKGEVTVERTTKNGNAADMLRQSELEFSQETDSGKELETDGDEHGAVREEAAPSTAGSPEPADSADVSSGTITRAQEVPPLTTMTIKTGALSIEIEKGTFDEKYGRVSLIAQGAGGYVSESRSNTSDGEMTSGTITIRVPNESFSRVLEELKELGEVTSISEQAQDVTEEYVDLESRIRNLRAQEAVYLELMSRAQSIEESISVQRELSVIQQQIEQLTGRKNYLDNQVRYSTIQVALREEGAQVVDDGEGWGFVDAWKDAAHGVVDGFNAVIRFLGNALIYIIIIAIIAAIIYYLFRKRWQRKEPRDSDTGDARQS